MEKQRLQLYTDSRRIAKDKNLLKDFDQKYKNYTDWDSKNFSDDTTAKNCWSISNKNGSISNQMTWNEFLKNYACDLDWAKDQEYCKVAPKQGEWVEIEDGNKSKFLQEFPCIASLIRGTGKQSSTSEGLVLAMPITYESNRCWVYMTDSADPNIQSKYDGLIVNRDTKDKGRFECEGEKVSSDDDNP